MTWILVYFYFAMHAGNGWLFSMLRAMLRDILRYNIGWNQEIRRYKQQRPMQKLLLNYAVVDRKYVKPFKRGRMLYRFELIYLVPSLLLPPLAGAWWPNALDAVVAVLVVFKLTICILVRFIWFPEGGLASKFRLQNYRKGSK